MALHITWSWILELLMVNVITSYHRHFEIVPGEQWDLTITVTHSTGQSDLNEEVAVIQGANVLIFARWNTTWD